MSLIDFETEWKFNLNLQNLTLVKIVAYLWSRDGVRRMIAEYNFDESGSISKLNEQWRTIENVVTEAVSNLPISKIVKDVALRLVKVVGKQIFQWIEFHEVRRKLVTKCYRSSLHFVWSSFGVLDFVNTAKLIVSDEKLEIIRRFAFACIYCLPEANDLYSQIGLHCSVIFMLSKNKIRVRGAELLSCDKFVHKLFSRSLEDRNSEQKLYEDNFNCLALLGSLHGISFYLCKLGLQDTLLHCAVNQALLKYSPYGVAQDEFPSRFFADIVITFLPKMNQADRNNILKESPSAVLQCLLEWPWQIFFINTAVELYKYINLKDFLLLLKTIKLKGGEEDRDGYDYKSLFEDFWLQSPVSLKVEALNVFIKDRFMFFDIFEIHDINSVKLLMLDVPIPLKESFVLCDTGMRLCIKLMSMNQWNVLEFLIQESIHSIPSMKALRKKCVSIGNMPRQFFISKVKWTSFLAFLDCQASKLGEESLVCNN